MKRADVALLIRAMKVPETRLIEEAKEKRIRTACNELVVMLRAKGSQRAVMQPMSKACYNRLKSGSTKLAGVESVGQSFLHEAS
jgi:hypothetical protein